MAKTKSVTFLCDETIHEKIQQDADENFEGNFSLSLRKILKDWNEAQN